MMSLHVMLLIMCVLVSSKVTKHAAKTLSGKRGHAASLDTVDIETTEGQRRVADLLRDELRRLKLDASTEENQQDDIEKTVKEAVHEEVGKASESTSGAYSDLMTQVLSLLRSRPSHYATATAPSQTTKGSSSSLQVDVDELITTQGELEALRVQNKELKDMLGKRDRDVDHLRVETDEKVEKTLEKIKRDEAERKEAEAQMRVEIEEEFRHKLTEEEEHRKREEEIRDAAKKEKEALLEEMKKLRNQVSDLEGSVETKEHDIHRLQRELDEASLASVPKKGKSHDLALELATTKGELRHSQQKVHELNAEVSQLHKRLSEAETNALAAASPTPDAAVDSLKEKLAKVTKELEEAQTQLKVKHDKIVSFKKEAHTCSAELKELRERQQGSSEETDTMQARIAELETSESALKKQVQTAESALQTQTDEASKLQTQFAQCEEARTTLEEQLADNQAPKTSLKESSLRQLMKKNQHAFHTEQKECKSRLQSTEKRLREVSSKLNAVNEANLKLRVKLRK